ncbi:MAG: 30S ribosomal protein S12 methylthiotransferase RimO [Coriobacteriia bacterium]|nr:30S ribosomal protein S12 methylthiotransferase RimO [Coriobacteriia bacterium]
MTRAPHSGATIAFITLGCPKNEVDSDRMRADTLNAGYSVVDSAQPADVIVVNTCSFIRDATEESIATVFDVLGVDSSGQTPAVIVVGCMVSRYGDELADSLTEVSAFLPVSDEHRLVDEIERLTGIARSPAAQGTATRTGSGPSAYLQISDGCHRACAYCTIPSIRGDYVSRSLAEVVDEAKHLVDSGARELVLIGQDITSWGRDLDSDLTLADLIDQIAAVPGLRWLRLMYLQPDGVSDLLLERMAAHANVCRYMDIPLQHASASVLRRMRRRGSLEEYLDLVERIRSVLPGIALRTTLIAGFPGETRADVAALHQFVRRAQFDYVGVFVYSPEEDTEAATLPDQVPLRTRRARAQRLRDLCDDMCVARVQHRIGDVLEVLVEGVDPDEGVVVGRWRGQAPEIDGFVLLDQGEPGQIVNARIVDTLGYDLEGEVLSE